MSGIESLSQSANQIVLSLDIGSYLIWYYILAIAIIGISFWASYRHKTATPFFWGMTLGLLIILFQQYLAPLLFGVLVYDMATQLLMFLLTGAFAVLWFGYIFQTLYNSVVYGEVVK